MTMKSTDIIKVRIKSNLNQRMKVFMNSQMLQHKRDKFYFFHMAFELKCIGGKCTRMVIKCDSTIKGKVLKLRWSCGIGMLDTFLVEILARCKYLGS
jgi:hypothetical protein